MNNQAFALLAQGITPSRRSFLIGAVAAGSSLVVGFATFADNAPGASTSAPNPFSGYLQISPDETVTIYSSQMDMGQGIYHGLATLVQEELDADWTKVSVAGGFGNPALYGNLALGGKIQFTGARAAAPTRR
jgi:isoquinoline 1-oxidoreductase subunit beta